MTGHRMTCVQLRRAGDALNSRCLDTVARPGEDRMPQCRDIFSLSIVEIAVYALRGGWSLLAQSERRRKWSPVVASDTVFL